MNNHNVPSNLPQPVPADPDRPKQGIWPVASDDTGKPWDNLTHDPGADAAVLRDAHTKAAGGVIPARPEQDSGQPVITYGGKLCKACNGSGYYENMDGSTSGDCPDCKGNGLTPPTMYTQEALRPNANAMLAAGVVPQHLAHGTPKQDVIIPEIPGSPVYELARLVFLIDNKRAGVNAPQEWENAPSAHRDYAFNIARGLLDHGYQRPERGMV